MTKIIFVSYIDFKNSSAGSARVRMYQKMIENQNMKYQSYSIQDHLETSNKKLIKFLNKNKYIRFFTFPLRNLLYVLQLKKFFSGDQNKVKPIFFLYPTTKLLLDYFIIIYLKIFNNQDVYCEINELRKFGVNIKEKSFKYYMYLQHEKLSRKFDGLICISSSIEKYYKQYNQNTLRIPILSNTDTGFIPKENYKINDVFKIGFTGSINIDKENFEIVFSALKILVLKGIRVKLHLYGLMYDLHNFELLIKKYNLESIVKFEGFVKQEQIDKILKKQDLLILPRKENQQNKYGFSTKLSEYLTSGVPTLVTDVSDNLLYLTKDFDCIVAVAEKPESFAFEIEKMINNYEEKAEKMALNAFNTAKRNFDYKIHSNDFVNFLTNLKVSND